MKHFQYIVYQIFFTWIVFTKNVYVTSYSVNPLAPRIIGGEIANAGQFSFVVAIDVETEDGRYFCGGTLITYQWVITAGHCAYNAITFTIRLGSHELVSNDENRVKVATSHFVIHPEFNPVTIENDIALIKLREPVEGSLYISAIGLLEEDIPEYFGVYALGWGQTSDSDVDLSNQLRYVWISTLTNAECKLYYGNQITDNMVCVVGNYNEGTCIGDNGGPLVVPIVRYLVLVGVASFISGEGCESTHPSGFTRVPPYYAWINNVTSEVDSY